MLLQRAFLQPEEASHGESREGGRCRLKECKGTGSEAGSLRCARSRTTGLPGARVREGKGWPAEYNLGCMYIQFVECGYYQPGCVGDVSGLEFHPR